MKIFAILLLLVISSTSNAEPVYTNLTVTSSDVVQMEVADKKAQLKGKGRIMKELAYSSPLDRNQVSTWCQRHIPEIISSFSSGPNELISIGECTCKTTGIVSMEQLFECEFPYSYRDASQSVENIEKPAAPKKKREKNAAAVSQGPALPSNKKPEITDDEQKKLDAEKKSQLAAEQAQKEKELAESEEKQKLEEKRQAAINDSKRHSCRHIVTATGTADTEADAKAQIYLESPGNTGVTAAGDPYTVVSSNITCKKQTTTTNPEYKCIGKQVNNVRSISECGSSADSQGGAK
ncbi:MAG: cell envelope integrity protein TolA [Methylobacter sp.]